MPVSPDDIEVFANYKRDSTGEEVQVVATTDSDNIKIKDSGDANWSRAISYVSHLDHSEDDVTFFRKESDFCEKFSKVEE